MLSLNCFVTIAEKRCHPTTSTIHPNAKRVTFRDGPLHQIGAAEFSKMLGMIA